MKTFNEMSEIIHEWNTRDQDDRFDDKKAEVLITNLIQQWEFVMNVGAKAYLEFSCEGGRVSDETMEHLRVAVGEPTEEEAKEQFRNSRD